jgi:uncharacterized lipoprotein YmbA
MHELEHQVVSPVRLLEAVDGGDVRVVQRGERARLAVEARQAAWLARELGSTLMATLRPSLPSCAWYTSPMPPAPSRETMW